MSARTDAMFDAALSDLLDATARGGPAERPVAAALSRTARMRQRPGWLAFALDDGAILRGLPALAPRLVLVGLLLLIAIALLLLVAGSQRRPPPFGPARNGLIAYESSGHIWLADADGTSPRQLTFGEFTEFGPTWSRDGTRLAYGRLTANEPADDPSRLHDLLVVDADGTHPVTILSAAAFVSNPTWSPDSRFMAFTYSPSPGPDHLIVAAADGSQSVDLGDLGGGAWGPTWSPDGLRIAVVVRSQLVVVNRDGSNRRTISSGVYDEVGSQGVSGDWSPNGGTFVFAAGTIEQKAIYLTALDGGVEVRIDSSEKNEADPVWSPDGTRLAFLRAGVGRGPVIVIADASGHYIRTLPGFYTWSSPVWSPDGTRVIVYDDRPGPNDDVGPSVVMALDPEGIKPPITLEAPIGTLANDNVAGSQQRLAP